MTKKVKPKTREERNAMAKIARKLGRIERGSAETLTAEEQRFAENYNATRSPRGKPPRPLTPRPANPPPTVSEAPRDVAPPEAPRPPPQEPAPAPRRTLTPYDATPTPPAGEPAAAAEPSPALVHKPRYDAPSALGCGNPACIYCTDEPGKLVCAATGKTYYEPLDNDSAEALGEGWMGLVGWVTRIARTFVKNENVAVEPNEKELRKMRKGVQKLAHRRANWLGGVEEFVLIGVATVSYGTRAFNEEAPRASSTR